MGKTSRKSAMNLDDEDGVFILLFKSNENPTAFSWPWPRAVALYVKEVETTKTWTSKGLS